MVWFLYPMTAFVIYDIFAAETVVPVVAMFEWIGIIIAWYSRDCACMQHF